MGLTMGTGPFGKKPAGTFNFQPDPPKGHALYLEPSPRRVRGVIGGETVVDSCHVALLHETGYLPIWYFPRSDVRFDLLEATEHTTHCPFKGDARYWTIRAGGKVAENKVWGYPEILPETPADHRSRGVLLGCRRALVRGGRGGLRPPARSLPPRRPRAELAHRARLAGRRRAGRVEPAWWRASRRACRRAGTSARRTSPTYEPTTRSTRCPYKGTASYWSVGGNDDIAWSYEDPIAAASALKGLVAFYDEVVDVDIDGERQERGYSPFAPRAQGRGVAAQVNA